jgi:prepilin-type processing-associated H-X9-DG protein
MSDDARGALKVAGLLDIEAYGVSAAKVDGAHVGSFHIVTSGKPRGFLPLAVGSPGPLTSARCVPGDFSLYIRARFSSLSDAWKQIKQTLRQMRDDTIMEEISESLKDFREETGVDFEESLKDFREETGVDFETDVLGSLGGEAALAAAVPDTLRIPDAVLLLEMKDKAKVQEILTRLLPSEEGTPQPYRNVTIRTTDMGPLTLAYALHEKYLILGTGVSPVKSAIDAANGQGSLAENSKFQTALKHLSRGNHLFYLDVGSALPLYVTVIGDAIARNRGAAAAGPLPRWQIMAKLLMSPLMTDGVLAMSTYGDEESVSLRAYSTFVGPHKLVVASSFMAGMLMPALMNARQSAQKAACMSNLKQIAIAEMMYATDHDGKFSERLSDLCPDYIDYLGVFTCPAERGPAITRKEDIDSLSSYVLRTGLTEDSPPNEVLIYEKLEAHSGGGNVAFVDGHVEWLSGPELERIAGSESQE